MNTAVAALDVRAVLRALRRATRAVTDTDGPDDAPQRLVEALVPDVGDSASIFVIGTEGRLQLRSHAPRPPDGHPEATGNESHSPGGLAREPARAAIRARAPAVVTEEGLAPVVWRERRSRGEPIEEFAAVAFPLLREDEVVGALCLVRGRDRRYGAADLDLLFEVGERVSQVLENVRLRREVRAARRAKGDFLAVMNHELRTPLTAVVGYADLLDAGIPGPVTEKQRRQLARIKESAWDLLELIDGILGYARYEGERPDLNVRRVQPAALLTDAVRVVEGAAEEKGLTISVRARDRLPSFPTDPEKARRILFHLLSNAVKFTPAGEVSVEIDADRRWVSFSVSDTGIGIKPEERRSIFEPFWQGERPETRTTGGAGMGLSLAQKLTELLSGEIEVESEEGRGSTFVVRFPREGPRPSLL